MMGARLTVLGKEESLESHARRLGWGNLRAVHRFQAPDGNERNFFGLIGGNTLQCTLSLVTTLNAQRGVHIKTALPLLIIVSPCILNPRLGCGPNAPREL